MQELPISEKISEIHAIQTASGTSGPTMKIVGIRDPEPLRDFLYERMRGAKQEAEAAAAQGTTPGDEALALLVEIRDELRRIRSLRAQTRSDSARVS